MMSASRLVLRTDVSGGLYEAKVVADVYQIRI